MLRRLKDDIEDNENLDRWLLTYADLITLLLAFFIVLYSISRVDSSKFDKISDAFNSVFRIEAYKDSSWSKALSSKFAVNRELRMGNLGILQTEVDKIGVQLDMNNALKTEMQARGLVVHISESAFFDPGEAELKPEAKKLLDLIIVQLQKIPNHIKIEGHTDNLPISTNKYPSNWELSTTRATSCLRYLIEKHDLAPDRISAQGYAEFRPIAPNATPDGRAQNRRVDLVILDLANSLYEPVPVNTEISSAAEFNK